MNQEASTELTEDERLTHASEVEEITARLTAADAVIVTEYRGMKVSQLAGLRRQLRDQGGEYKVYKNTLARFAADNAGVAGLADLMVGPTALAFVSGDAAAVAKVLRDAARTDPLLIVKGGAMAGKALSASDVEALAELPSREVLLAQFAGALKQVVSRHTVGPEDETPERSLVARFLPWLDDSVANNISVLIERHLESVDGYQPLDIEALREVADSVSSLSKRSQSLELIT